MIKRHFRREDTQKGRRVEEMFLDQKNKREREKEKHTDEDKEGDRSRMIRKASEK